MLPQAYLILHSKMSGSTLVITPLWLSGSLRSFLYSSSVYSCFLLYLPLLLGTHRFCPFTAHLCMKCSLGISNFLEEISSLSHSVVFLYFFSLITWEDFLLSPCYSLELCIQLDMSFLFSLTFYFSYFLRHL